ncbi:UMP kinase [Solemya velum gill symbiont]|uniref:UMP kinase n=1 Tax=Solemya velum gill symbiont TaxID=2340 RepID=UPI000997654E|nr:UMP kinase [Solemya velum gill symbiont]OOZ23994.1 UMP kinase [Solemya velum gill symbiont]
MSYQRILLKLSGEALMGNGDSAIDPEIMQRVAADLQQLVARGVQVGLVIGGGNIFRGAGLVQSGINRVTGDYMGMLATVMNALAMHDFLRRLQVPSRVYSSFDMQQVCEPYQRDAAVRFLETGGVALFSAGTGSPFFTTDTAAALRAVEIGADLLIKATRVDGVYDDDPLKNPQAKRYERLDYDRVVRENLGVMDLTAILLCRDHGMPLRVMDINEAGALLSLVEGEEVGTLVHAGEKDR